MGKMQGIMGHPGSYWVEFTRVLTLTAFALVMVSLLGAEARAQQVAAPITLEQAMTAANAAMAEAKKLNSSMVIAVVEPNGSLVYFVKMDGAPYGSVKVAIAKAVSAALYRRPSKEFADRVAKGDLSPMALVDAVASAGGVPIVVSGKFIGAVGSSGGQDHLVSQAGADALK